MATLPGLSERRSRLKWAAGPLRPAKDPFYLSRPNGPTERAPGWYMTPAGWEHPIYLGANHVDAEIAIVEMVRSERAPAAG